MKLQSKFLKTTKYLFTIVCILALFTCNEGTHTKSEPENYGATKVQSENNTIEIGAPINIGNINIEAFYEHIDLNMDISNLNLSEIRIIRNAFAARQGYCFMKADLRGIYSTTSWYDKVMNQRFWEEDEGKDIAPISYTVEEKDFIDKLRKRENELMEQNFSGSNVNVKNIVNPFQFESLPEELLSKLGNNGFAIMPNENIQLFHVYEQNDYQQVPHFVTTDMYMQLFHMYFGYVLKTVEQSKFIPQLSNLTLNMKEEMDKLMITGDENVKNLAEYGSVFYAIAYTSLTGEKIEVSGEYSKFYEIEISNINNARDAQSEFLGYNLVEFPYSLFKPRGHYTRTDELKKYFKSMMWLQTATYCLDNEMQFKSCLLNASILKKNPNIQKQYKSILEPVTFIIGETDNVSFLDIASIMHDVDIQKVLSDEATLNELNKEVKAIADRKNVIRPKVEKTCRDKINFMPQRYVFDNEILQELVDVSDDPTKPSKRAYPKGLDVFAAMNCKEAENILLNDLKTAEKWPEYIDKLDKVKEIMAKQDMDKEIYSKWIKTLVNLQKANDDYPYFMQTKAWKKKDLNSCLASWAELKHDAILYAEQPMAAECGGAGPPEPYTVGYVEPNVNYWNGLIGLMNKTMEVLNSNDLMISDLESVSNSLLEKATFLRDISLKELKGSKLSQREYQQIEFIGSDVEWLTLQLVKNKDEYLDSWSNVKGPDKSVSVIADVYTANSNNNPDKGILHVGTGLVNDIYVVVEIEGYLYLTKGAVLSYHEFHLPLGNRLTDEEWQEMLDKNEAKGKEPWMNEIIVPIESPKPNEKIFYSSGC